LTRWRDRGTVKQNLGVERGIYTDVPRSGGKELGGKERGRGIESGKWGNGQNRTVHKSFHGEEGGMIGDIGGPVLVLLWKFKNRDGTIWKKEEREKLKWGMRSQRDL